MKVASFRFTTANLGDSTQAIAAASYLPYVDALVDRDALATTSLGEPHLVIMNSWFQLAPRVLGFGWRKKRHRPSDSIIPVFHGFCVGRDRILNDSWLPYLAERQPIGCRDLTTVARLQARSIGAYWTGCISAVFGRQYVPVAPGDRSKIVIIDVPADVEAEFVPAPLRERAVRLTNRTPPEIAGDPLAQMHMAAEILDVVRRAELVVTSRLHIALPCVGFQTPVVVIVRDRPNRLRRFSGFDEFLPMIYYGDKTVSARVDWDSRAPVSLPDELAERHGDLLRLIEERVGAADRSAMPTVAATTKLAIPDHDFGGAGGEIGIGFGSHTVSRSAAVWTRDRIEAQVGGTSVLSRFRLPLRVRPRGRADWVEVGPLSAFVS